MARGLKRFYGVGDLHYITFSCYQRRPLLGSAQSRDLFLKVLEQVRRRYQFVVIGYVVMPEHVHLLLSEPQQVTPSKVMQALKLGFARRLLASNGDAGTRSNCLCSSTHRAMSGRPAFMTSMSGPSANGSRNSAISIAIRSSADWSSLPRCGAGAVTAPMPWVNPVRCGQ